ncbi:MAG TPA: FeoA family protein [Phycisphaerales bacterium]|nr:FeoA family protein [Phycisphaerales bacterium]
MAPLVPAIPETTPIPLASLRQGQSGVMTSTHQLDAEDAALLRAMGLCTNSTLTIIRRGHPCVVAIGPSGTNGQSSGSGGAESKETCACGGTCRIGLAKDLAQRIFVTPVP